MEEPRLLPFRPERRAYTPPISEDLIEEIAEKAADKALKKMENRMYQTVGKTFINKLFQFIGVVLVSAAIYLNHKGVLKF